MTLGSRPDDLYNLVVPMGLVICWLVKLAMALVTAGYARGSQESAGDRGA